MKLMKTMKAAGRRVAALAVMLAMTISMAVAPVAATVAYADDSSGSAASDAANGVVRVLTILTESGYEMTSYSDGSYALNPVTYTVGYSFGTGFGIGETAGEATDTFATNRHVVTNDDYDVSEIWILLDDTAATITKTYSYYADASGDLYYSYSFDIEIDETKAVRADILYASEDEDPDVAVIQARSEVSDRVALALISCEDVSSGDSVWALGFPGDSDFTSSSEEIETGYKYNLPSSIDDITVTTGNISRIVDVDSYGGNTYLQHTASISSGNSGGPLLDENGAVIGINTFIYAGDTDTDYYALEIDYLIDICEAEGIPYAIYSPSGSGLEIPVGLIAGIAVVVVVVVAVLVMAQRKKAAVPETAAAGGSVPEQAAAPASASPAPAPAPAPASTSPVPAPASTSPAAAASSGPAPVASSGPAPAASAGIANDSGFRIQGQSGVFAGRRFAIAGQLSLGRDPSKNDLVFPGDTKGISGVHCVLGVDNAGQVTLMDLGSTYGTYLAQGQRLAAHQPVTLTVGDVFYLGSTDQQFVLVRKGGQ